ncbi:class I SAM-dependent methyltransferase [Cellulomonas bogoriensis]|uniref:Methyltransferase type 11 n=1 Tax=Cellulomonas bogoriensis 69B4 = DSM 16987 TaxID=1386082 RepID=A0A0A0C2H7_9CELL|nr:methyltransferase domain-containing protein [Cellulomonas bogoriensis]KGM14386.1 methyltransferase type 11 [Cellulomonas bogoriensis 69B4 = DSM 16987]
MTTVYVHGHHESVLRAHRRRTAANSAGYLLPHLRPDHTLLDVGCGPGTVTVDLARHVRHVTGLDASAAVLDVARGAAADAEVTNVGFEQGDALALPFEDDSMDVVHAHQVLQHLTDPVAALREMGRVARPGGLVAVRDADYAAMTWYPPSPGMTEWLELYHEVTAANGVEADAGRRLLSWARQAGFDAERLEAGADTWCYTTPEDRAWWSGLWAERVTSSEFARQALTHALADDVALEVVADGWRTWGAAPDGWFAVLHGWLLVRV